jgi:hypothetical protein
MLSEAKNWFGLWGLTAEYLAKVPGTIIFKARKPENT